MIINKIKEFYTNLPFDSLSEISPKDHIVLKTFNTEFQEM